MDLDYDLHINQPANVCFRLFCLLISNQRLPIPETWCFVVQQAGGQSRGVPLKVPDWASCRSDEQRRNLAPRWVSRLGLKRRWKFQPRAILKSTRELCDFHMPPSWCYHTPFFRLLWDLNQMKTERLCSLSWFILAFFSPPPTPVPVWADDIEEEMPLTSHAQGTAAQVNRLSYSVHVGMATTFLIVSFFYCNFHLNSGRWRHHAVLNGASEKLHMRLLISPLRLPYLYYLLNKRNHSKQVESCWRYKSMGSGAV